MQQRSRSGNARAVALPEPGPGTLAVTPRLAASWQRSQGYGIAVDVVEPVFTGSVDTGSLLNECASQVLRELQSTLPNEPISLMVADHEGLVLTRLCNDRAILRSLDRVHLAPGFYYAERHAGTNGLGLSLADRTPTLVRANEHYCTALRGYTCAAAPVLDPVHGDLVGTINLTTWSRSSSELLLALAQSAAGTTSARMLLRAGGHSVRPAPRGEVFHVWATRASGDDPCVSRPWRSAQDDVERGVRNGQVVAVVGESGAGKNTLVSHAHHAAAHRDRVLIARVPPAPEVDSWLALWTPELHDPGTCVIVSGVDRLPAWAAGELAGTLTANRRADGPQAFVLTAVGYREIPRPLAALVDALVEAPPLRTRGDDILPLARHFAQQERRRPVEITASAARALTGYDWPGNAAEVKRVVRSAAARGDVIETQHLDPTVFSPGRHTLTRLEAFERDEIVRCLTAPNATVAEASAELGMSRATIYRKIGQYDIEIPGRHITTSGG